MNRAIRITGLILASLTVSTVAMAQSSGGNGGGGNGGAGGGSNGGGGDNSVIELRLQDHERARLTRAVEPRRGSANCITHVCNEPRPTRRPPARDFTVLNESCGGGEYLVIRNRQGQVVRYVCENR